VFNAAGRFKSAPAAWALLAACLLQSAFGRVRSASCLVLSQDAIGCVRSAGCSALFQKRCWLREKR